MKKYTVIYYWHRDEGIIDKIVVEAESDDMVEKAVEDKGIKWSIVLYVFHGEPKILIDNA